MHPSLQPSWPSQSFSLLSCLAVRRACSTNTYLVSPQSPIDSSSPKASWISHDQTLTLHRYITNRFNSTFICQYYATTIRYAQTSINAPALSTLFAAILAKFFHQILLQPSRSLLITPTTKISSPHPMLRRHSLLLHHRDPRPYSRAQRKV